MNLTINHMDQLNFQGTAYTEIPSTPDIENLMPIVTCNKFVHLQSSGDKMHHEMTEPHGLVPISAHLDMYGQQR
jgi:hypothetical protein